MMGRWKKLLRQNKFQSSPHKYNQHKYFCGITLVLFLVTISCNPDGSEPNISELNSFASCLTKQGAKMYGAEWCSHCQEQKKIFGDAFKNINYTECTVQKEICATEKIQYLPTWKFADETSVSGVQSFEFLAEKTGCVLE